MPKPNKTADETIDELTPAERRVLVSAIEHVQRDVFEGAIKKIRNWIIATAGVLTCFGIVTFAGIRATIVDATAKRLAGDSEIKSQVIERAAKDLEETTKVLEKAEALAIKLDTELARGTVAILQDLKQIHHMIDQVRGELELND